MRKLESVNPKALEKELSQKDPVLLSVLKAACGPMYFRYKTSSAVIAALILLNPRNQQLCLLQSLVIWSTISAKNDRIPRGGFYKEDGLSQGALWGQKEVNAEDDLYSEDGSYAEVLVQRFIM